ncbi:aldehyde dehydrogenase family protein [Caryophanon tenue]|uniref:Aldehyde dehydrogenase n=1 Tax=Caryophanon tenue TaxID=33978 RepID=A0A1C0YDD1_9BACL|nr:aldehyde dehydrogenase family protein [Caryophanon tenue]OCS85160.1 aldehyde dehydrogenase [Caryophanon tenue]
MVQVTTEKLQQIFDAQTAYQWDMRLTTAEERIALLTRLKEGMLTRLPQFIEASQRDYITPATIAEHQVYAVIEAIDHAVANLAEWMQPEFVEQPANGEAYILYEARGRVCVLGTWNSPMSVLIHPLVEALAAGNCVVLKPSEFNPSYNAVLQELIDDVFEEQQVALVQGEAEVSQQLLQLPFDHFFFTGSPRIGKIVMKEAAQHLAAVTLELGGKSPAIVDKGYDPVAAVQQLVFGKVLMSGQFCICPDYIYVHEDDIVPFVEAYKQVTQGMLYDNGVLRKEERTQIVNETHYRRLKGLYEDAIQKGAIVLSGGTFDDDHRLIEPTLLGHITDNMHIAEEEIFGPLTFVRAYSDVADVVKQIQERPKPLALYMFSKDEQFQQDVLKRTSSGGVTINGIALHNTHISLPFGGVNNSGLGNFHGIHGFKTFSHSRAVFKA